MMKICEGLNTKKIKYIIIIVMRRGGKKTLNFIQDQELWEGKEKGTSKGSTLEPHLGYEKEEK
jgi:hypothetical protein